MLRWVAQTSFPISIRTVASDAVCLLNSCRSSNRLSLLHKAENAAAEILASIRDAPDQIPAQSLSVRFVEILQSDESGAGLLKDVADPLLLRKFR